MQLECNNAILDKGSAAPAPEGMLTPDAIREELAARGITEVDVEDAITWARKHKE